MTVLDKLRELSQLFKKEGIEDPAKEAVTLLTETLHINTATLHSSLLNIDEKTAKALDSFAARRMQGEPLQYIIGHVDFWGVRIHVGKGVLIPRPETELMVEETIKIMMDAGAKRHLSGSEAGQRIDILDLCTGSGCIALALGKEFLKSHVYAIDKSALAISYARRNAEHNKVGNVSFMEGDLFSLLKAGTLFDCIVSNPPYIKEEDIGKLQREIKDYEPVGALDGGPDGLDFYRRILKEAPRHLKKTGIIILEIGVDQADDIRNVALNNGFNHIRFVKDYAGIERIFVGRL